MVFYYALPLQILLKESVGIITCSIIIIIITIIIIIIIIIITSYI
jgi:hypothetical protein